MICETCHGNGFIRLPSREPVRCPACGGSGETKEKESGVMNFKDILKKEGDLQEGEESGLRMLMLRGPGGHWCGYVGVPAGHPLHGVGYSDKVKPPPKLLVRDLDVNKVGVINLFCAAGDESIAEACPLVLLIDVHGGLTWAGDHAPARASDGLWWFGFDCAHSGDLSPKWAEDHRWKTGGVYRDADYARRECESLAKQLSEWRAV